MGLIILAFVRILFLTSLLVWFTDANGEHYYKVFNVKKYGAVSDGKTENSKAFLKAWSKACQWHGKALVLIPQGVYLLDSVVFQGECNGYIAFYLRGKLKPVSNMKNDNQWITFRYVDGFLLNGGGVLDAEGYKYWPLNDCHINPNCHPLPISLRLEFIRNGRIDHIRSVNSQNAHISVFGCSNLNMTNLKLSAPGDSPNTDGIKIGSSQRIKISKTRISTGDDCVAILSGSRNVDISKVFCGPGHGISVGSMGRRQTSQGEEIVEGLRVRNCTFNGTTDGLRIKTWASFAIGLARNFRYKDIRMISVGNPININQQYCPYPPCNTKVSSHIQIEDITFNNIWGTSASKVAVTLNCSSSVPCQNIVLKDINLFHHRGGSASSLCSNAKGTTYGHQRPPSCF